MLALVGSEELKDPEFKWIIKRGVGGKNKDIQFYESFSYDGVHYALHDNVYMHKNEEPAPYIGKLVKIWETAQGLRKIKVQWFFRPSEISCYLKDVEVSENELFFASGDGKGLANLNPLEAIAGKCNIVCTSPDSRNPQPSAEEIQMADYVFYRIFDVKSCTISDQIGDTVGGLKVNFVFNRRLSGSSINGVILGSGGNSESSINGLELGSGGNSERTMVVYKEISDIAGKNSPEQLNNSKLDNNGNHVLEKEDTHSIPVAVKQGSLDGKHISGVDVNSSKDREITGTNLGERSTTSAKNVGSNICEEKDKLKDIKLSVTQDPVGKGVKHARKSCDLDDTPSKRAKVNGLVPSDSNGVQGVKDSVGCRKDVKVSEGSSPVEKLSKAGVSLSTKASISGHVKDALGLQKVSKSKENPNALQGKPSSEKEKLGSAHRKDSIVAKDKKVGANVSTCEEKKSGTNVVSHDATRTPLTTDVPSKGTPISGPNKKVEGSQKVTKPAQSLSATKKRPLEISAKQSKEKPYLSHDKSHENKEKKLGGDFCPEDEGYPKKAKLDNIVENNNNNIKMSEEKEEKNHVGETQNLPKITSGNNNAKSRLGEGHEKEKTHVGNKKNSPTSLTCDDKPKSKLGKVLSKENHNEKENNHVGKMSKLNNKAMSKLGEEPSKEYHNEKDESKDDGGKVGAKIIEVTQKPLEKATWMKLSWEQQMKTGHDQGRLVLLQNLDPEYTSGDVEDIIWHAFEEHSTARVLPHTAISNPHSGQALVVFKSRVAADRVVQKLDEECLMLPNQRPLVATYGVVPKLSEKQTSYVGHLDIGRDRRLMQREMKEAVSTSHYSQHNTIEFEMAMEWCLLQSRSEKWWKNLYELQLKELKKHTHNLKSK